MPKTIRLTAGQAVAKFLQVQYSERDGYEQRFIPKAFGILGHGNLSGLGQGFLECAPDIQFYQPFHEQSMVHAAVAFARAKRRLSTFACTASIGPGTANMYTGASGATVQRVPVLLLCGDHYATRRQGVVLQQLEHPTNFDIGVTEGMRAVSVFFDRIMRPEQLIPSLPEAIRVLLDPASTGAATIAIAQDVQGEAFDFPADLFEPRVWRVERKAPDAVALQRLAERLGQARRPMIIAGGGVYYSEAETALLALAEGLGVPVAETVAGKSVMRGESDLALGALGIAGTSAANRIASEADFVLAVGTRLSDVITCSQSIFANPEIEFATINITGRDSIKQGALPVVADARAALTELKGVMDGREMAMDGDWHARIASTRNDWAGIVQEAAAPAEGPLTQTQALAVINEEMPADSYVVAAAGSLPGDVNKLWDTREAKRCHLEFGFSCMTYEIPAGVGLVLAEVAKNVTVCIGDGTYLMNPSELITAVREGLSLTVIVFVNRGYQIIRDLQEATTGHGFATEFRRRDNQNKLNGPFLEIDLAKNAESLGANAARADSVETLGKALRDAYAKGGVNVIAVDVDPYTMSPAPDHAFWDIAPPETSQDQTTVERRASYDKAVKAHRYHV